MSAPPRKPHDYEIALRSLESLAPHFRCGICQEALDDAHFLAGCLHRFCRKCILDEERMLKCGNACPSCGHPISNKLHIIKDTECDEVMKGISKAVKHLQNYEADMRAEEAAIDEACEEADLGTWCSFGDEADGTAAADVTNRKELEGDKEEEKASEHHEEDDETTTNDLDDAVFEDDEVNDDDCNKQNETTKPASVPTHQHQLQLQLPVMNNHWQLPITTNTMAAAMAMRMQTAAMNINAQNLFHNLNTGFCPPSAPMQQEQGQKPKKRVNKSFDEHFEDLKKFKEANGHCNVVRRLCGLGAWCHNLRRSYKELTGGKEMTRGNTLTEERIKKLEDLGFRWSSAKTFDERYEELTEFKAEHGHCNVPMLHSTLGRWCGDVRRGLKEINKGKAQTVGPTLTPERIEKLKRIGFLFTKNRTFDERLEELIEFKELHGHCSVPILHSSLGRWCGEVRRGYRTYQDNGQRKGGTKLTVERIKRLKEIGFQFVVS